MNGNKPSEFTIEQRHRTLLILWFALCMSPVLILMLIRLVPVAAVENPKLTLILNTAGLIPVAMSFLVKQVILGKAVVDQQLQGVHTAYIVAWALCEVAWLLSFVDNRMTGSSYYYLGFAVGGLGMLLHFPRKQHLLEAAGRQF